MDLLATVRKEGSRGGAGDFKWTDVQSSSHREHYLGHSLMAPVGRWQRGRDLNWYAKQGGEAVDGENAEERAVRERKEEIRRVKEAEEDALARALGRPVPDRTNANNIALGNRKDIDKAIKDTVGREEEGSGTGIGFGAARSAPGETQEVLPERIEGNMEAQDREMHTEVEVEAEAGIETDTTDEIVVAATHQAIALVTTVTHPEAISRTGDVRGLVHVLIHPAMMKDVKRDVGREKEIDHLTAAMATGAAGTGKPIPPDVKNETEVDPI